MKITILYPLALTGIVLSSPAFAAEEDTIIVSASKQSSYSASANNVSATKVSEAELKDAGVTSTDKLTRVLPGLNMANNGSLLFPSISLRGVSSAQDFYSPATTLYVDGVPQLATYTVQQLSDVSSVEMLRGPQGTLYGKSAQGGIINIVSQQPDSTPRGYIEGGVTSREGYHGKINLSGPIQDGLLYGSVTLLRQVDNGSMTNPATGSSNLGGTKANVGNIRLRLAPDGQPWETSLAITEDCTRATQDTYLPFDQVDGRTLEIAPGSPDPKLKRCTHSQAMSGKYTTDNWVFSLVGAWQQQNYERTFPNSTLIADMPERWNQDVQELRAATYGGGRSVDMVFGLYRQNTREKLDLTYSMGGMPVMQTQANTAQETLAAYSDLTWHLDDRIDLGAGLRVSHDKANTRYNSTQSSDSDDQVLGQLSASYLLNEDWRIYTRVAQGYKPAGFSYFPASGTQAAPYEAEKSINYEIGSRYQHDEIQLQGALFHTHTRNMQLYSGPVGMQTLSNAGSADASGVEMMLKWQFMPAWSWDINGTYVRAEFTDSSESYADKRVPFVPRYNAGTSINGIIDTEIGPLMPRVGLNVVGPHYFDGDNALRQGTYSTTDLRLGWQATERVNIAGYVDNLFDTRYRTFGFMSGTSGYAQVNNGRTVGVDVRVDLF
ncbi:TonB-dependent siderophore receptor [Klebsiella sp. BIGb0407]|uniref:TonB-dependent siderophore receptor n=1 Tax=Klebsiella sp. BIGb0407 TaxID=2940603 RepID=UPI00216852D4|nr:TonB-dependent siderophore receptor [Klebsiella sp. BIGb0407]MCS3433792.1 pesticin/yersiniabactin receptor [Klebsiella sp. BIGb0407]